MIKPNTLHRVMPKHIWKGPGMKPPLVPPKFSAWERIGLDLPTDMWVYSIRTSEIREWIEQQPVYMWKFYDADEAPAGDNYVFTEEMIVWFELRWG